MNCLSNSRILAKLINFWLGIWFHLKFKFAQFWRISINFSVKTAVSGIRGSEDRFRFYYGFYISGKFGSGSISVPGNAFKTAGSSVSVRTDLALEINNCSATLPQCHSVEITFFYNPNFCENALFSVKPLMPPRPCKNKPYK